MILYASQRGRSAELAAHLLNGDQNDHVSVHEIRGFVADTLSEALKEVYAISRGTRCSQFLFSVSLNPPETQDVPIAAFEEAIEMIEKKLGLSDQPRIVVFHEKHGRRHCHAVWSRIDADTLTAVNMGHFKRKLTAISAGLFLRHGWPMPKGLQKHADKSPFNMTREEHRQAVRKTEDPQVLKALFRDAWERSESKDTFARALEEQGFYLARGDRRGYVALDIKSGIYSLTRWLDIGTRALKFRLGPPEALPDIEQAKAFLASRMTENIEQFMAEAKEEAAERRAPLVQELRALTLDHREDRRILLEKQQERWIEETLVRSRRLSRGMKGIWERITGVYQETRAQNEIETTESLARDRQELETLIRKQLHERQDLQKTVRFYRDEQRREESRIRQEVAGFIATGTEPSARAFEKATASEKVILAAELAEVEAKISLVSGDIASLQASLGNALLSDEMRAKIRHLIDQIMHALHLEDLEEEAIRYEEEKEKEILQYRAMYNEYIQQSVELQHKIEKQERKSAANRDFYAIINRMSYSLNGIPQWEIKVMPPPAEQKLDEKAYVRTLKRQSTAELLDTALKVATPQRETTARKTYPPVNPQTAVPQLRQSVLQVKEILRRAGHAPSDGGRPAPEVNVASKLPQQAKIVFNAKR